MRTFLNLPGRLKAARGWRFFLLVSLGALAACSPGSSEPPAPGADPVLAGAGDIAECNNPGGEATAKLLDSIVGTVLALGDNVYESGTAAEFATCYEPTWGRHKARTRPSLGNHEYLAPGARDYFAYFGPAAGDPGKGYYSYNAGTWHVIVINSNCAEVDGCHAGSAQEQWLRGDLAAHRTVCTLAYWHTPRFSSGEWHGSFSEMQPIWQALYDAGADVVLSAHEHNYERFAPQDPNGVPDPVRGIREFVVGTGGKSHYPLGAGIANSEVRNDKTFGVLKLTLHPTTYDWEFVPVAGETFTDSGVASCHQ
ncbi:MAG TPA: metallophosphoesterase [Candidatus Tectomicrobia bacterium]